MNTDRTAEHAFEAKHTVYVELHTQRRVHQDGVVQLGGSLRDVDRLHLLEAAQRVTLGHQL